MVAHAEVFDLNEKDLPTQKEDYKLIFNNLKNKSRNIQSKGDRIFGKQKLSFISNVSNKIKQINDLNHVKVNTERDVCAVTAGSQK